MVLAEPTFLKLTAGEWEAIGVWVTGGITIGLLWLAWRQLVHAREARNDQTRPFVIVDVDFRSILIMLTVKNTGLTAARKVRVTFDEPLTSAATDPDWQASSAFKSGIPFMAPGRELRFFLDSYLERTEKLYPMVIKGVVKYFGPIEDVPEYEESFLIDLTTYEGTQLPEKGMHELVGEVITLRKELAKWTLGVRGLRVNVVDHTNARNDPSDDS
jgi:hypothetical protein